MDSSSIENIPITPSRSEIDSDFEEINSNLLKIIEKNGEKINSISNYINISEIVGFVFFFAFLLTLTIRLSEGFNFYWLFLLIPLLISIISFNLEMNLYLRLKDLITEGIQNEEKTSSSLGSKLSYFCLNTGSICFIFYFILLGMRLDKLVKMNFNEIAIPLYVLMGIVMFYYIFIFPAFLKNKMLPELFLIGLYIITIFLFVLLINIKIDTESNVQYCYMALSLLSVMVMNIIFFVYSILVNRNEIINNVTNLITISMLLLSVILICLKLDKVFLLDNWIPLSMIIFSFLIFVSDKIFMLFENKNLEESSSTKNENDN